MISVDPGRGAIFNLLVRDLQTGEVGLLGDFLPDGVELFRSADQLIDSFVPAGASPADRQHARLLPPLLEIPDTSVTSGQWRLASGMQGYNRRLNDRKGYTVREAERHLAKHPSRTADGAASLASLQAFGESSLTLFGFYQSPWFDRERFYLFRRRTSLLDQLKNIIVNRVRQLEAVGPVVVAWGAGGQNGSFGKGDGRLLFLPRPSPLLTSRLLPLLPPPSPPLCH